MSLVKRGRSGMLWIDIRRHGRRVRKSTGTSDEELAQRIHDKILGQIAERKWFERLPGDGKAFKEMMDRYETEHVPQKRSARQYSGYIKNLRLFFGGILISNITPSSISDYKAKRRKDGVGPASINRELAVLKNAFNKAMKEWGWARENPVTRVHMEREPRGRVRYLTEEEFQRLYNACADWLKPIVLVARHTGMRRENLLSLTWKEVDLRRGVIILEHTKNGEAHGIPLNATMMALFSRLSGVRYIRSPYVFHHPCATKKNAKGTFNGRRYYEIKTAFRDALKEAGIEDFRWHDLRHQFASDLVQRGVRLEEVAQLLGHKTLAMTRRYAHLSPENLRNAVQKLDWVEPGKCGHVLDTTQDLAVNQGF